MIAQACNAVGGHSAAGGSISLAPPIEMLEAETNAEFGACRFQCFKSFRHDFFADTISGDNGYVVYVHCSSSTQSSASGGAFPPCVFDSFHQSRVKPRPRSGVACRVVEKLHQEHAFAGRLSVKQLVGLLRLFKTPPVSKQVRNRN